MKKATLSLAIALSFAGLGGCQTQENPTAPPETQASQQQNFATFSSGISPNE